MKFEDSIISKKYTYTKKTLAFGELYFLDNFIIAEMNHGIHLSWNKIVKMIDVIHLHYGVNCKIAYISNKINSYSYDPNHWVYFFKHYNFVVASVSICYSEMSYINASLEKQISSKSVKRSNSLEEAVSWVLNLEEFK
ncbi:hypothetical protein KO494_12180 [Lacinutrix sp. C3R15]|uniref:hypothetical protein n=1 Tax=Flavobacteriaceae TaxID=49546 RepID=UPI001C08190E|nr:MULTISPECIES: hypothetical protein [Flavobacteriaceae]MBU2940295.1 hypothetical protein [Lacinutrix sp. C3R15]MDO6623615.1 hypothetical protein [Oceanihabitans sp. 1_MG-2023]